jgi:cytochrome c oxidase subunit 2
MLVADFSFMPRQASTMAGRVDGLFFFITGVVVFFSILIATLIIYFAIRYRRRFADQYPPKVHGSIKLEIVWSVIPLLICLIIFVWGAEVYFALQRPPDDAIEIYVVARQWMWKVEHPEGQREINTLHIPAGQPVKLILASEDVIHSFYVPAFRTKQDAVPGRYTQVWFQATEVGSYHLFCAEYCGTEHSRMIGKIVVMDPAEYQAWLTMGADGSLAQKGRQLFTKLQCITCHTGTPAARAPVLEGIFNTKVPLNDGRTVLADDNYLRESILQPAAKIVAGYQPIMPTYQGQVSEEELVQLLAFLKSLKQGQTPPRVEETPAPVVLPNPPAPRN